jgi:hypothetical protein
MFSFYVCYASGYGSIAPIFRSRLASNSRARATIYQAVGADNRGASK